MDLFEDSKPWQEPLAPGAMLLRHFAASLVDCFLDGIVTVAGQAAFRHMVTPRGYTMSVAMTNCGSLGWTSSKKGYYYSPFDPLSGHPWPPIPTDFASFCQQVAVTANYPNFKPNACLISRYTRGSKLSLHQDKDELDLCSPIISVSIGLPAIFQFGGIRRNNPLRKIILEHGDVVVWGGESRLFYHGICSLKFGIHPTVGKYRYNLSFRRASNSALK